jgi:hypothetical protein
MQPLDEAVYECSFARADFTGERDEAFAILDTIHQPAQRFFDLFGKKKVARIWIDVERILFQPEIALIHGLWILAAVCQALQPGLLILLLMNRYCA